jgi:hypothetical protein
LKPLTFDGFWFRFDALYVVVGCSLFAVRIGRDIAYLVDIVGVVIGKHLPLQKKDVGDRSTSFPSAFGSLTASRRSFIQQ